MKGDFARVTFDATRHVRRVMRQQGRVDVEADSNEQVAVLLHHLEAMMRDIVGPYAAPRPEVSGGRDGFKVVGVGKFDLRIEAGHYWVGGALCENDAPDGVLLSEQRDHPMEERPRAGKYLVYIDVWERHLSADEAPWIVEVALGGPDTSTRTQLVWQVKVDELERTQLTPAAVRKAWDGIVEKWQPRHRGALRARAVALPGANDPCVIPPDSKYRGPENQLYRIEVRDPGPAGEATFVWSRDNGSVVYPVRAVRGREVIVDRLPIDARFAPAAGQSVELCDDESTLLNRPGPLLPVVLVDPDEAVIELDVPAADPLPAYDEKSTTHPLLRRWDQPGGAMKIEEGTWLDLEDGVQVLFEPATGNQPHRYRTGDHWVVPARVATGDVEWPAGDDGPQPRPPHGVWHRYAPLAVVDFASDGTATVADARRRIVQGWQDL